MTTTIAVIDDNTHTQAFLRDLFAERGWNTLQCTDIDTALEAVGQEQPDLIILDLWFDRHQDGWSLLTQLKETSATASIPVVVCSGDSNTLHHNQEKLERLAVAVLLKPFDIDHVYACVDFALAERRMIVGTDWQGRRAITDVHTSSERTS
jgi:DNA-binding response OmpR family regulator